MKVPVFMYHALFDQGRPLQEADPFYAISAECFNEQIEECKKAGYLITSLLEAVNSDCLDSKNICVFTFDDGHISNYLAAEILHRHGFSADFFINTANIGKENYLNEKQLKHMFEMNMSIQSHGHEHVYISDLSLNDADFQLSNSKKILSNITGKEVTIYAPPGGRINPEVISVCKKSGYTTIANSKPGIWTDRKNVLSIPRFAVLRSTSLLTFKKWLQANRLSILKLETKYLMTRVLKLVLGNKNYERIRGSVVG